MKPAKMKINIMSAELIRILDKSEIEKLALKMNVVQSSHKLNIIQFNSVGP